ASACPTSGAVRTAQAREARPAPEVREQAPPVRSTAPAPPTAPWWGRYRRAVGPRRGGAPPPRPPSVPPRRPNRPCPPEETARVFPPSKPARLTRPTTDLEAPAPGWSPPPTPPPPLPARSAIVADAWPTPPAGAASGEEGEVGRPGRVRPARPGGGRRTYACGTLQLGSRCPRLSLTTPRLGSRHHSSDFQARPRPPHVDGHVWSGDPTV